LGHIYVEEKKRFIRADSFPSSNYTIWLGNRKGPGRISSTASDLLKWDQVLYTEILVKKETLAEAFSPVKLKNSSLSNYGFGWEIKNEGKIVLHTGDNPGYKTEIIRHIDKNKTLLVLCNNAYVDFDKLVNSLDKLLINE
jgi:Beta-lactamase